MTLMSMVVKAAVKGDGNDDTFSGETPFITH